VRTLALSIAPNAEKTARRWLGVVEGGIEPTQSALVGCVWRLTSPGS